MFEAFAGTGMPGLGAIGEGYQRKEDLDRQRKEMEIAIDLENRAKAIQNRKVVGSYVSDVGASGVDLTLDEINQVNKEYALDIAVAEDYRQRQGDLMKAAGKRAVTTGWIKGGVEIATLAAGASTGTPTTATSQSQQASTTSQSIDTNTSAMMKKKYSGGLNSYGSGSLTFGGMQA
jgi:hypothetical protein